MTSAEADRVTVLFADHGDRTQSLDVLERLQVQ
jgi:hypothetical protein